MKIKEFIIHRYGPLAETGRVRLNAFNLFWGENEEGKTLTIEALIKLLLGRTRKLMTDIDRVNEEPDGYLIIEHAEDKEAKIPDQGRISDLVNLSAEECANLFIIRNSDLSISKESEFYGSVTERLTGLRSSQIQTVKRNLRQLGYLTDSLQTVNDRNSQYLSGRLAKATQLIEKCRALLANARESGFDRLEEELVSQKQKLGALNNEIQLQEKARLREKFEQGQKYMGKLTTVQTQLTELKNYDEDKLAAWLQADQVIKDEQEQIGQFKNRLKDYQHEIDQTESTVDKEQNELEILTKKQTRLSETLKPLFIKHRELSEKLSVKGAVKKFLNFLLAFVCTALLIALAGIIWKPNVALYLAAGVLATAILFISFIYFAKVIRPLRILEKCKQDIFSQAGEFGFTGEGIPELQTNIQRFDESIERERQTVNTLSNRLQFLRSKITEIQQEHLARSEKRLQNAQQVIQEIRLQLGVNDLEEYQKKLRERKQQEQFETEAQSVLKNLFGDAGKNNAERIKFWQSQISQLNPFENEAGGTPFDEVNLEQKKYSRSQLQEQIAAAQKQLEAFQDSLSQVERETREVLLLEKNSNPCQNLLDLSVIISKLQEFLSKINDKQTLVGKALEIFSEIEAEEIQKVGSLFGAGKPVSDYFQTITQSLYQAVHYDPSQSLIQVERADGKMLSAKWLSGGAYDQLYFAIRLALGKELLQGQTGFFILDDPFIKSDRGRLERMMDILVEISRQNWQILYFSAKDEILDVLKKYVDSKEVSLHQVPKSKLLVEEVK